MFRKYLSLFFIGLFIFSAHLQTISAQSSADNSIERNKVEKIKTDVYRRGTGEKSKVVVKLKDGAKVKGFISRTGEDSFTLTDSKSGKTATVAYSDVAEVKKPGLSTGTKIAIGAGIAAAVAVVVLSVAIKDSLDDFGSISICCGRP